ncbi:MAG: ribbon-helix-helix domain-containing protein [Ignisphaera sp.]|jgi:metal-responsive CopG/Arc/MetJ family transcriptional regulator|nr:ribbon-helix-helix domain-containing protein [Ignisphaera sp.]MCC6055170.1 ribbon-helix-helix domain-containing protein [Desulfurococcaceae archaeon]
MASGNKNETSRSTIIELGITLTKVISLKLDIETLNEIEQLYKKFNYKSRSEFIRDAIQFYIKALKHFNNREKVDELFKEMP